MRGGEPDPVEEDGGGWLPQAPIAEPLPLLCDSEWGKPEDDASADAPWSSSEAPSVWPFGWVDDSPQPPEEVEEVVVVEPPPATPPALLLRTAGAAKTKPPGPPQRRAMRGSGRWVIRDDDIVAWATRSFAAGAMQGTSCSSVCAPGPPGTDVSSGVRRALYRARPWPNACAASAQPRTRYYLTPGIVVALIDRVVAAALGGMTPLPPPDWAAIELDDTLMAVMVDAARDRAESLLHLADPPPCDADDDDDEDDALLYASFFGPPSAAATTTTAAAAVTAAACKRKRSQSQDSDDDAAALSPPSGYGLLGLLDSDPF
jgi:hypothetical protein